MFKCRIVAGPPKEADASALRSIFVLVSVFWILDWGSRELVSVSVSVSVSKLESVAISGSRCCFVAL